MRPPGVLDRSAQAHQTVLLEEGARPTRKVAVAKGPPAALHEEAVEAVFDVAVESVESLGGVAGAEVVRPAAQDRVEVTDEHAHILDPVPVATGQLLHALPDPLHAALRRPSLEEVN